MSTIRVIYQEDEIELFLRRLDSDSNQAIEFFIADNKEYENLSIELKVKSGIVIETTINGGLTIFEDSQVESIAVIERRAQEAISEYLELESTGIQKGDVVEIKLLGIKPYDPDTIKVRQERYAMDYVVNKMIPKNILDLNPDFQRKFVWDRKRQSRLIESILLGIPIPLMYLAESAGAKYHVVDGLQRITTFRDYMNNKFPLKDLEHLSKYEGCYFSKKRKKEGKEIEPLDDAMVFRIESYQLHFNVIEKSSPDAVKYDIFERINTGGMPLNPQEIRNCNSEEKVRKLLVECANSNEFIKATDKSIKSKRMDDQETVLRFCGFYLVEKSMIEYNGNMTTFLNDVNEQLNKCSQSFLDEIKAAFINSMKVCYYMFGKYAFRKCMYNDLKDNARKPLINISMFVVISTLASSVNFDSLSLKYKEMYFVKIFSEKMYDEFNNEHGVFAVMDSEYNRALSQGTSDIKSLQYAKEKTEEIFKTYQLL